MVYIINLMVCKIIIKKQRFKTWSGVMHKNKTVHDVVLKWNIFTDLGSKWMQPSTNWVGGGNGCQTSWASCPRLSMSCEYGEAGWQWRTGGCWMGKELTKVNKNTWHIRSQERIYPWSRDDLYYQAKCGAGIGITFAAGFNGLHWLTFMACGSTVHMWEIKKWKCENDFILQYPTLTETPYFTHIGLVAVFTSRKESWVCSLLRGRLRRMRTTITSSSATAIRIIIAGRRKKEFSSRFGLRFRFSILHNKSGLYYTYQ